MASVFLCVLLLGSFPSLAFADDYDATMAAHPLRIVAYVLHPVGVMLDMVASTILQSLSFATRHEPTNQTSANATQTALAIVLTVQPLSTNSLSVSSMNRMRSRPST